MRKWTTSACVLIAWSLLALLTVVSSHGPSQAAQANSSIASSTKQAPAPPPATLTSVVAAPLAAAPAATWTVRPGDTLSAISAALALPGGWQALYAANRAVIGPDPNALRPGMTLTLTEKARPVSYQVAPGETLSAIAAALALPGGWQALYAANRQAIGPDPDLLRAGMNLVLPPPAAAKQPPSARPGTGGSPASPPAAHAKPGEPGRGKATVTPKPGSSAGATATTTGAMPGWVKGTLLAAGLLTLIAFIVEPALLLSRRRRGGKAGSRRTAEALGPGQSPSEKITRIIQASHERLIVTYSVPEDTVYLLTPPGEDPRSILRAARLVMPENTYEELAEHLGIPSGWRE
jgi:LysM repeat protein